MEDIFDQIARIEAVTKFQAENTEKKPVEVEEFSPKKPTIISHYDNEDEFTLSLCAVNHLTIDICMDKNEPDNLVIAVSDRAGNQVTGVVITPALLQTYLNDLAQNRKQA